MFQVEKAGGRCGRLCRAQKMRFLPEGRFPADQKEEGSGRDGRVLEHRSDRWPFELFDARVVAGRRRGWRWWTVKGGQRQRKWWRKRGRKWWRRQDHRVHDHYEPRSWGHVSGTPSPPPPPSTPPAPKSAPAPGDRGRRAHHHGPVGRPAHGHRDERE